MDANRHDLSHDPFKAIITTRPIGWIGSKGRDGSINLSRYSGFNGVCASPKIIMFASGGRKNSARVAEETGVFTANFVSRNLVEAMNLSSVAVFYGVDEFALAGLTAKNRALVDAPSVAEAFAVLECRATDIRNPMTLSGAPAGNIIVFGEVVGISEHPQWPA